MVSPEGACAAYYNYGRYSLMQQARTEQSECGGVAGVPLVRA
jgi:hypothetical protein